MTLPFETARISPKRLSRRSFTGGSDARIIMGSDEPALPEQVVEITAIERTTWYVLRCVGDDRAEIDVQRRCRPRDNSSRTAVVMHSARAMAYLRGLG